MPRRGITARPTLAALAAAVLALAGCGAAGEQAAPPAAAPATTTVPSSASAPTSPASTAAGAVPPTLTFTARTLDGTPFEGASLAGKPAVLWFWAAWCTRCRSVADEVAAVQRDNAARMNLVGVAGLGSGDEAMRRFARDTGIEGFPNLADDDGEVWRRFGVTSQEYYVLLDSAGEVVHSGPLSQADLRQRVAALS